jgi:hypothetical protein
MKKCPSNREFYEEEYVNLRKSVRVIAKEHNISSSAIYRKLCKFGLNRTISQANVNIFNGMWKGDSVGIKSLHEWICNHKQKPEFCENCKKNKPYDLANVSQKYKRNINDFKWLCRRCHMQEDGRINNLHRNKRNIKNNLFQCPKCKKFKDKLEFYHSKSRNYNISAYCSLCMRKLSRKEYRKTNPIIKRVRT